MVRQHKGESMDNPTIRAEAIKLARLNPSLALATLEWLEACPAPHTDEQKAQIAALDATLRLEQPQWFE